MKFGVFLPNGSNGYIPSRGSPVYEPTFEHNKAISIAAERHGDYLGKTVQVIPHITDEIKKRITSLSGRAST